MATEVQRQTDELDNDHIADINDHLHIRGLLSIIREPATAETAVWPAIRDVLESMGKIMDLLKKACSEDNSEASFCVMPGICTHSDGLIIVYALIALLSEGNNDVIIPDP